MDNQTYTIANIADKLGLSKKTVHRCIREHPELGIVMLPKTKTVLTADQASMVSSLLAEKSQVSLKQKQDVIDRVKGAVEKPALDIETQNLHNLMLKVAALEARLEMKNELISKMEQTHEAEIQRLEAIRAEDRERLDRALAESSTTQMLLESAEAKARTAEAEASSYHKSWFGLYRKDK